jgi:hypothetical protein
MGGSASRPSAKEMASQLSFHPWLTRPLLGGPDLADVLDVAAEQGPHHLVEPPPLVALPHLGGDLQRHPGAAGDAARGVDALVRVHAPEEGGEPAVAVADRDPRRDRHPGWRQEADPHPRFLPGAVPPPTWARPDEPPIIDTGGSTAG